MDIDALFQSLDMSKIPEDQIEGYKHAMLRLWKTPFGTVVPVTELHDDHIMNIIEGYAKNKFVYVEDFIKNPAINGVPNIWLDILTEELERRYHGSWN